jgi:hypothetical protein
MKRNRKHNFLSILILFALLLTSCGGAGAETDTISTAVAMTVAAQETERAQATATPGETKASRTSTPEAMEVTPTSMKAPTFAPPTAPGPVGSGDNCINAQYVTETIPDGTIMKPDDTFWKSWTIKNNGTCTWDSSYKFVYESGDLMGGLLEYPLTELVPPGDQTDITIYLRAPSSNGNYKGNWKILSPWGGTFGVGEYDTPLWVQINVNDESKPDYGVTNVTYTVVRDPAAGCATNVWYYVNATITTNGPAIVNYQWLQSDGNNTGTGKTLKFTEAGSQTITRSWSFHLGATPGTKWMQIIIHEPNYQEYPQATFVYDCK